MGVTDDVTRYVENLPSWGKAVLAGGVSLAIYVQYKWLTGRERKSPLKEDWKDGEPLPFLSFLFSRLYNSHKRVFFANSCCLRASRQCLKSGQNLFGVVFFGPRLHHHLLIFSSSVKTAAGQSRHRKTREQLPRPALAVADHKNNILY